VEGGSSTGGPEAAVVGRSFLRLGRVGRLSGVSARRAEAARISARAISIRSWWAALADLQVAIVIGLRNRCR